MAEAKTPAVIYAAKSTEDKRGSIPTQLADCRAMAEREGWEVVAEFQDEGFSAYHGNRGPGLEAAKRASIKAADERGSCVLVVQHSDRVARGAGDEPGAAEHLVEVVASLRRQGVQLRTVEDDLFADERIGLMMAGMMGQRNTEDSRRRSKAVTKGLRRAAERGGWPGGIPLDGYRVNRWIDSDNHPRHRAEKDPSRKPVFDSIWDLARRGFSCRAIAAELDQRGYKTDPHKRDARPRPFDANRVCQTLDNPRYAGLQVHRGEVIGVGDWPRYVTPEDFYRLRAERRARANVERRGPGRPPEGYVLAGIAVCGECGSPMRTETGRYVRKDGTSPRRYVCQAHLERVGVCSAKPVDAGLVDPSVIDRLPALLGEVDGIRARAADARAAERRRLEAEVQEATEDVKRSERGAERANRRAAVLFEAGEDEKAEAALEVAATSRRRREDAIGRRDAALDALSTAGEPADPEAEQTAFYERLRELLAGRLAEASDNDRRDVKRLNLALRDFFESFELTATKGGVQVMPMLSEAAAARILADIRAWPGSVAASVVERSDDEPDSTAPERLMAVDLPDGANVEQVRKQLEGSDIKVEVDGPESWESRPGEKSAVCGYFRRSPRAALVPRDDGLIPGTQPRHR